MADAVKVVHIITCLSIGGAEMMLWKLISASNLAERSTEVISLTDIGPVGRRIEQLEVPVRALGMSRGFPSILALFRLSHWIRESSPQIVQTWMYHSDLVGGLAAGLAQKIPVVWGIRNGVLERVGSRRRTIWTAKLCARLSRSIPKRIVVNSEKARLFHERMGYCGTKMTVIPNGFDLDAFQPAPAARLSLRQELRLPKETILIGLVARFDLQKDHRSFIKAAGLLTKKRDNTHFLLCGDKIDWQNATLVGWIREASLQHCFHLLGRREDIPSLTAALDIATCSSYAEGFPNILGEAMACGVPCATTDAGDCATIVGETGIVVPTNDAPALAEAWRKLIDLGPVGRERLGERARRRIEERFDLRAIAARYAQLYRTIAAPQI